MLKLMRQLHHSTRRRVEMNRPFNVIVEGNIGSGKTTFLNYFSKFPDVVVQTEPVDKWTNFKGHNLLSLFYQDMSKWAFSFESYVLLTMIQHHHLPTRKSVRLMERSLLSAKYIFIQKLTDDGYIPPPSAAVLDEWFTFFMATKPLNIDLIVYLRASPEVVDQRIKLRNREGEKVSLDYLKSLHDLHERWLIHKTLGECSAPVLVLDANLDKNSMVAEYEKCANDILYRGESPKETARTF